MQELIKRRVVFVDADQTMTIVVQTMCDQNVSSVLVLNKECLVVGIVTERDIVQKFTLLEKREKLEAKVAAFMTRPVSFARLSHLEADVHIMFFQKRLRHFPVADGSMLQKDILGMLTVTDMTRAYLQAAKMLKESVKKEPLIILSADETTRGRYKILFESLNFSVIVGKELDQLMKQAFINSYPLLLDIDDLSLEDSKKMLSQLKVHQGVFIVLSSQSSLVEPLSKMLSSDLHFVALKPLDISYILMLLSSLKNRVVEG